MSVPTMGEVNPTWEKLAEVRARAALAKSKANNQMLVSAEGLGDPMANFVNSKNYSDGSRAFRFDDEMKGFAYYKSGCTAVVVAKVNDYSCKFFFYNDNPKGGDLICFISEYAEGFAVQPNGEICERLIWNSDGGSHVEIDIAHSDHKTKARWRWDQQALNSGNIPKQPITIRLNENLEITFKSLEDISVKFQNEGLSKSFDCGLKLNRSQSYLDGPGTHRNSSGKLSINLDPMRYPSLQQRQAISMDELKLLRATMNPKSDSVDNKEISDIIKRLEESFQMYHERIKKSDYTSPAIDQIQCRKDALERTLSEVPTVKATGNERGSSGKGDIQLVGVESKGKRWIHPNGKAMNNLEIRERLEIENPVLQRPAVLKSASGRYSRDMTTGVKDAPVKKLKRVSAITFDTFINDIVAPTQLVFLACLRADSSICRRAEQQLQLLHGELAEEYQNKSNSSEKKDNVKKENDICPYVMVKFEMSESDFMVRRYNIHSLPMYMMFYGGKVVYAGTCGGKAVAMTTGRELPRVLLCEPNIKDQLMAEKLLRKIGFQWDLALSLKQVQHHMRVVQEGSDSKGYGIVLVGDSLPDDHCRLLMSLFSSQSLDHAGEGGQPLPKPILAMCLKSGVAPFAKGPLMSDHGGLLPKRLRASTGKRDSTARVACLKTRIILNADDSHLKGGHFALQKPLSEATLKAALGRWRNQEFTSHPTKGQNNSGKCISKAESGFGPLTPTSLGMSREGLKKRMFEARQLGLQGKFLSQGKLNSFGLNLSSMESTVCGVTLTVGSNNAIK